MNSGTLEAEPGRFQQQIDHFAAPEPFFRSSLRSGASNCAQVRLCSASALQQLRPKAW